MTPFQRGKKNMTSLPFHPSLSQSFILLGQGLQADALAALVELQKARFLLAHLKKEITSKKTPPNQLQLFQASLNRSFSRHKACNRMPSQHSYRAVSCVSCCSTSRKKSHREKHPQINCNWPQINCNSFRPLSIVHSPGTRPAIVCRRSTRTEQWVASLAAPPQERNHIKKTPPNQLQLTPNQLQLFQASLNRSFSRHKACNRMPSQHSYRAVSCVSCCSTSRKKSHQEKHPQINCNWPQINCNSFRPLSIVHSPGTRPAIVCLRSTRTEQWVASLAAPPQERNHIKKNTPKLTATDPKSIATLSGLSQSFILQAQGLQSYALAALVQSSELRLLLLHLKKEITSEESTTNNQQQPTVTNSNQQQPTTTNNQQPTTNNQQPTTTNNSRIQFLPQRKHKEPTKGNPRDLMLKVFDFFEESLILGRHNDAWVIHLSLIALIACLPWAKMATVIAVSK